jgi:PAS domain S-box-containing protein
MVLKPCRCEKHVLAIGESAERSSGFVTDRNDEIGTLSREFSHMVDRLAEREKGLELGERRLRQILDLVPHFIFAKDKDGRFVLVNKAVADFFNTSPKNLIGRKESDFIDAGQGHQENFQEDQEVISSGKSVHNLQQEITDFQGNRRFVQTSKIPFILADVTSPTVLGVSVDITDLKMAEEALRESRTRLSDIIDFLPDATFALDREGKPIAWNRAMEEMSGISKQEIMSRGRYDKSIPFYGEARPAIADLILEDMDGVREKYDYVLKDNDKLISEAFAPCLYNGRGANIWVVAAPLYDAHGGISGVIESIRDITERKKAEELLKRHSETIEQSLDGIVMADLEGRVTYANKAWSCMHGYSEDEMSGMHLKIFHTQEQFENEVVAFHKKAFEQGSHRGRLNHIRKDGTVFPTLMSAFMLKDEKDRPIALVAIARDSLKR